jgi:hypothetical protein
MDLGNGSKQMTSKTQPICMTDHQSIDQVTHAATDVNATNRPAANQKIIQQTTHRSHSMINMLRQRQCFAADLRLIGQMAATAQCLTGIHDHSLGDLNFTALLIDQMTHSQCAGAGTMDWTGGAGRHGICLHRRPRFSSVGRTNRHDDDQLISKLYRQYRAIK